MPSTSASKNIVIFRKKVWSELGTLLARTMHGTIPYCTCHPPPTFWDHVGSLNPCVHANDLIATAVKKPTETRTQTGALILLAMRYAAAPVAAVVA
jgi:hypothetical protein